MLALARVRRGKHPIGSGGQRELQDRARLDIDPQLNRLFAGVDRDDHPLAGMGADESQAMVELLRRLAPDHAILLVEHDMDAVFRIADRITVMVNGSVIASDAPEGIRGNAEVQAAYLGGH